MRRIVLTEPQWQALVETLDGLPLTKARNADLNEAALEVRGAPYQVSIKRSKKQASRA